MVIETSGLTLEAFLALPEEKPGLEYFDGVVSQKMAGQGQHVSLQGELRDQIRRFGLRGKVADAFVELRTTYAGASVVPDVSVYAWHRIPLDENGEIANAFTSPPDIAIEIVSPNQSVTGLVRKCLWYVAHGVRVALLVDPLDRSVLAFRLNSQALALHGADRIELAEVLPEFDLTVDGLFASLRR